MNEALSTNHTLLGLHMEGENCIIDAQGYIQAREETVINPLKNAYYSSNTRTKPLWDCSPSIYYSFFLSLLSFFLFLSSFFSIIVLINCNVFIYTSIRGLL